MTNRLASLPADRDGRWIAARVAVLRRWRWSGLWVEWNPGGLEAASSVSNEPFLILIVAEPKLAVISRSRSAVLGHPLQSTSAERVSNRDIGSGWKVVDKMAALRR